ncbi:hypothetical protein TSUD_189000 [Trifolium subterraneum]|uniref:Uncharacterized protein n=1 Tax=Trifolium subterraneum TaxID=3900 RepID=A0A2Z6P1F5_TRISU|nr:hypothetical protein TSUD_189000 [Trifolium subterraneum]
MPSVSPSPYEKPLKSVRPPLIPSAYEPEKQEEGFFGSLGKLLSNTGVSMVEIMGGLFPVFRRRPQSYKYQRQTLIQQPQKQVNDWPAQEMQEQEGKKESVVITPVGYGGSLYEHRDMWSRMSSMGYNYSHKY